MYSVIVIISGRAWYRSRMRARMVWFDPPVWQHSFFEIGHEIISTPILSLPLIQVGQFSVTGEKGCALNIG